MDDGTDDDARWMVINGRRWRRTDPCLPDDVVEALKSHLGRGRSSVRTAKKAGDDELVAAARRRVGLAKLGLGVLRHEVDDISSLVKRRNLRA